MRTSFAVALTLFLAVTAAAQVAPQLPPGATASSKFFIRNTGQYPTEVDYYVKGSSGTVYLAGPEIVYDFLRQLPPEPAAEEKPARPDEETGEELFERLVFRCRLEGSDPAAAVSGEKEKAGKINYFIGSRENWKTGIPTYGEVLRSEVYPGIDQRFFFRSGNPVFRLEISPGADPARVVIGYTGVDSLEIAPDGSLLIATKFGTFGEPPLRAWQSSPEGEEEVEVVRLRRPDGTIGLEVGKYDPTRALWVE